MRTQHAATPIGDADGFVCMRAEISEEIWPNAKQVMFKTTFGCHPPSDADIQCFTFEAGKRVTYRFLFRLASPCHDHSRVESARKRNTNARIGFKVTGQHPLKSTLKLGLEGCFRKHRLLLILCWNEISVLGTAMAIERPQRTSRQNANTSKQCAPFEVATKCQK